MMKRGACRAHLGSRANNIGTALQAIATSDCPAYNPASTFRGGRGHFLSLNPSRYSITKVTPTDSAITEAIHETSPESSANT